MRQHNNREENFLVHLIKEGLEIFNRDNFPNFINRNRCEVFDITFGTRVISSRLMQRHVSNGVFMSDHRHKRFNVKIPMVIRGQYRIECLWWWAVVNEGLCMRNSTLLRTVERVPLWNKYIARTGRFCNRTRKADDCEEYRTAVTEYNWLLKKTKQATWKAFCDNLKSTTATVTLHNATERYNGITLMIKPNANAFRAN